MALDSFLVCRSSPNRSSLGLLDADGSDHAGRFWPCEIDRQQSIPEIRTEYLHSIGQHERALELTGGDAAVQVLPALVVLLTSPDDQLFLFDGDLELIEGEARNRQRDAQAFRKLLVGSE